MGYGSSYMKDFWEYDPALNMWTRKADFGGTARTSPVGFSIGNRGYVGTGSQYSGSYTYYKDFWEYNPALNTWTRKTDFGGTARHYAVGFSIGGKGYIGTGMDGANTRDFWEYSPTLNTWTRKADFGGTARRIATGFSIAGKGYIGTGWDSSERRDFWEYDPALNTWAQRSDFGGTARRDAAGFSIGGKGYIGTGRDNSLYYKDFWEYDPNPFTDVPSTYGALITL